MSRLSLKDQPIILREPRILVSANVELNQSIEPDHTEWKHLQTGVLYFYKNYEKRSYYFQLSKLVSSDLNVLPNECYWEYQIGNIGHEPFIYNKLSKAFHYFPADGCYFGFNFLKESEAKKFLKCFTDTKEKREKLAVKSSSKLDFRNESRINLAKNKFKDIFVKLKPSKEAFSNVVILENEKSSYCNTNEQHVDLNLSKSCPNMNKRESDVKDCDANQIRQLVPDFDHNNSQNQKKKMTSFSNRKMSLRTKPLDNDLLKRIEMLAQKEVSSKSTNTLNTDEVYKKLGAKLDNLKKSQVHTNSLSKATELIKSSHKPPRPPKPPAARSVQKGCLPPALEGSRTLVSPTLLLPETLQNKVIATPAPPPLVPMPQLPNIVSNKCISAPPSPPTPQLPKTPMTNIIPNTGIPPPPPPLPQIMDLTPKPPLIVVKSKTNNDTQISSQQKLPAASFADDILSAFKKLNDPNRPKRTHKIAAQSQNNKSLHDNLEVMLKSRRAFIQEDDETNTDW